MNDCEHVINFVTKEITFDCAHMLSHYDGKCNNLHGHTYKVQISLGAKKLTSDGPHQDMLVDFNDLKEAMDEVIMKRFDHAVIFSGIGFREQAEEQLLAWAKTFNKKYYVMPRRTTAENMAQLFQTDMYKYLNGQYSVIVKVWETPTSFAEVL